MKKMKSTAERGKFKIEIHNALYKSSEIKELLLGEDKIKEMNTQEIISAFKECVKSHLFIDETITEARSYIFYDIRFPSLHSNTKKCQIIMYVICHREILEDFSKEGYYGDRADILCQMVEDALINNKDVVNNFGIGELTLDSIDIYNATRFYGSVLTFSIPSFR